MPESISTLFHERLWSRQEAAFHLGVKPETLAKCASTQRYDLPYVKVGSRAMYRRSDLDAYIARNVRGADTEASGGASVEKPEAITRPHLIGDRGSRGGASGWSGKQMHP